LRQIVAASESGRYIGVALIDIDQFKEINDAMGTNTGDLVLKMVAKRLAESVRPGDLLARLAANSFVLALKNVDDAAMARVLTQRAITLIATPIPVDDTEIRLTASAGVALFPTDARDADALISRADAALDLAKEHGRDRIEFSSRDIDARLRNRQALRQSILRGLGSNEFELYLQPEIDIASGLPAGAEALVRWNHPDGRLSPGDFIPFAEEHGLIRPLSLYIVRRAMESAIRLAGIVPGFRLFFNLSAHDLAGATFTTEMSRAIAETGVDPHHLGVEVTESTLVTNVAQTAGVLKFLRGMGLAVALDDFGTGYSSLAMLKSLPIDVIKLDRSFTVGLPAGRGDAAIVRNLITIGHDLGMSVLVEGVENAAQYRWLRENGCDRAQGHYLGRPMTCDALAGWLVERVA
jgi:diguanylate cyclase (GGDEF)-like protein